MSRNSEKHFVGLNRIFLNEQWTIEKSLKRPALNQLVTADEVRKWIPSIKRDLEYYIQQLSGARKHKYTDSKLNEFEKKVSWLEKEHQRFVKKVFELDPNQHGIPWEPKSYSAKRKIDENSQTDAKKKKPIVLNILKKENDNVLK
nr:uncharacterized protein LOC124813487 [Hydra vulgaris]